MEIPAQSITQIHIPCQTKRLKNTTYIYIYKDQSPM